MNIINSFNKIKQVIKKEKPDRDIEIIAVSKTFSIEHIMPLIEFVINISERIKFKKQKKMVRNKKEN